LAVANELATFHRKVCYFEWMDTSQKKIIELLREVHVLAIKEIERLNLKIAELEAQLEHQRPRFGMEGLQDPKPQVVNPLHTNAMLNEKEVARWVGISVSGIRRWRLLRRGPRFLKIGSLVRYRREDVTAWLDSEVVDADPPVNRGRQHGQGRNRQVHLFDPPGY
jgi:predicted DNA-binding transcriptional regulator AlpA